MTKLQSDDHLVELMSRIEQVGACWIWFGPINPKGYGTFRQASTSAHRAVYELFNGPIPEGMTLDHLCRTRSCVNPDHMEPVTLAENQERAVGNLRKQHVICREGHPLEGNNLKLVKRGHLVVRSCRTCNLRRNRESAKRVRLRKQEIA